MCLWGCLQLVWVMSVLDSVRPINDLQVEVVYDSNVLRRLVFGSSGHGQSEYGCVIILAFLMCVR